MAKPQLNRESIVATSIQLADEEGLDAVSLRGIAKRLEVHVTSLYNYFPTKEAVLAEMTKALVEEAGLPRGDMGWQDWVRRFAHAFRNLAHRHPGAFQIFQRDSAQGEQAIESLESAIAAFRADGFDLVATSLAFKASNVFVMGLVMDDLARRVHPEVQTELGGLSAERYPNIRAMLDAEVAPESFDILLNILIDGIAAGSKEWPGKHSRH